MEENGAVFLAAAGRRVEGKDRPEVWFGGSRGYYWSSSAYDIGDAFDLHLSTDTVELRIGGKDYGVSVRLVRDVMNKMSVKF